MNESGGISRAQGWIIIVELGILLIGLYQAGQAASSTLSGFSNSTAGTLLGDISGLFGSKTIQAQNNPQPVPII